VTGSDAGPTCCFGIIGATVMPHVVYLHSALHKNRIQATGRKERRRLLTGNRWDCIAGLGAAGLVNLAMLCVAAALFHKPGLTGISDLDAVHRQLGTLVGGGAALAFGVALMASGLSSCSVGTYAGQIIMAGFMNWRVPLAARRLVTMLPSLIILALAVNTTKALVRRCGGAAAGWAASGAPRSAAACWGASKNRLAYQHIYVCLFTSMPSGYRGSPVASIGFEQRMAVWRSGAVPVTSRIRPSRIAGQSRLPASAGCGVALRCDDLR
jgi:Natural resistance-associated macrophage protein